MFALTSISYDGDHGPHEQVLALFVDEGMAFVFRELMETLHKESPVYVPTSFRIDKAFVPVVQVRKP